VSGYRVQRGGVSNRLCRSIVCLLDSLQPFRWLCYGSVCRVIAQLQNAPGTARQKYFPHSVNSRRSLDGVLCIHFMDTGKPFQKFILLGFRISDFERALGNLPIAPLDLAADLVAD